MRDRMPGRYATPWCPTCHRAAGRDCPTRAETPRQVRRRLKRQLDRSHHMPEPDTTARAAAVAIARRRLAEPVETWEITRTLTDATPGEVEAELAQLGDRLKEN